MNNDSDHHNLTKASVWLLRLDAMVGGLPEYLFKQRKADCGLRGGHTQSHRVRKKLTFTNEIRKMSNTR